MRGGERVEFEAPEMAEERPVVLWEDGSLRVVNKPAGIASEELETAEVRLVHRLDKETTGVLLLAKSEAARKALVAQFAARAIKKRYLAIVDGVVAGERGVCRHPIGAVGHFAGQTVYGPTHRGKEAETRWRRVAVGQGATLVACFPKTGRTHQIRVHWAALGHPLWMDRQYGERFQCKGSFSRFLLHAQAVALIHPATGAAWEVSAPLFPSFHRALQIVGLEMGLPVEEVFQQSEEDRWGEGEGDE
jgi:RluA family pseudouridine synthase